MCSLDWGEAFELKTARKKVNFRTANDQPMEHPAEMVVTCFAGDSIKTLMRLTFQVTEVKSALATVWRICKKQCWITNQQTNYMAYITKQNSSYVLEVEFVMKNESINRLFLRHS